MLAKLGRRHSVGCRRLTKFDRTGDNVDRPLGGMLAGDEKAIGTGLGVVYRLPEALVSSERYSFQKYFPLLERLVYEGIGKYLL